MDAEVVPGLVKSGEVDCQLVRLLVKTPKGTILRSFNVYLDPARGYAMIKAEKYWDNFVCLERVVEVTELTAFGGVYLPSRAKCTTYDRPDGKMPTSAAVSEQELTVTHTALNAGVGPSQFNLAFAPGVRVTDSTVGVTYTVSEPRMP
jgi:hypothetical protein